MDFSIFDSFDMSVFTFFGEQIQNAAMNIVYIGDIELIIEQCIGVTSGMATRNVSCVTKYPRKAAANIFR